MGMPEIGDRIEVTSFKAGPRAGTVAAIDGRLITVRWDSGEQTSLIPGPGVLNVVARGRGRKPASKQATATTKTQPSTSPTLSPSSKTRGSGSTASVARQTAMAKKATTKASTTAKKAASTKSAGQDSPRTGGGKRAR
jgi:hypothetical protein